MPILETLLAAAVPALLSAGGSALGSYFGSGSSGQQQTGTPQTPGGTQERISRFTPEQTSALNTLLTQSMGNLGQIQPPSFEPIEQRARSQFQKRTIPMIAERFAGLNAMNSSAFPELLGQAGSDLEESLAAQRAQFGQQQYGQQLSNLFNLLGLGLTPQFDTLYRPEQPSMFQSALPGLAQGFGQSLPSIIKLLSQFASRTPEPPKAPTPAPVP